MYLPQIDSNSHFEDQTRVKETFLDPFLLLYFGFFNLFAFCRDLPQLTLGNIEQQSYVCVQIMIFIVFCAYLRVLFRVFYQKEARILKDWNLAVFCSQSFSFLI
jgi:hypothetical protein